MKVCCFLVAIYLVTFAYSYVAEDGDEKKISKLEFLMDSYQKYLEMKSRPSWTVTEYSKNKNDIKKKVDKVDSDTNQMMDLVKNLKEDLNDMTDKNKAIFKGKRSVTGGEDIGDKEHDDIKKLQALKFAFDITVEKIRENSQLDLL